MTWGQIILWCLAGYVIGFLLTAVFVGFVDAKRGTPPMTDEGWTIALLWPILIPIATVAMAPRLGMWLWNRHVRRKAAREAKREQARVNAATALALKNDRIKGKRRNLELK